VRKAREEAWREALEVRLLHRVAPAKMTTEGQRALSDERPISPASVQSYLEGKFGDDLKRVRRAMEKLARSLAPRTLATQACEVNSSNWYMICNMRKTALVPAKRSVGRPSLYRRQYCDLIVDAMATGLSAEAAAAKIGISARSLFYWQRKPPEFFSGHPRRPAESAVVVEERALALANGEPGNTQILALKNRSRAAHGWNNEALQVEHSVTTEPPKLARLDVTKLTFEQRQTLREILLAAKAGSGIEE